MMAGGVEMAIVRQTARVVILSIKLYTTCHATSPRT
jgi:hypothetical protein